MTITKPVLLTHLDYSKWADQKLLEACNRLSAEELSRDLGSSHGGVLSTLRHVYYAERIWLNRLRGQPQQFQDAPPEPAIYELQERWPSIWSGYREWLEVLPEADLETELHTRRLNGDEIRVVQWKVLLHVVNHSTLHRGQIMAMLRQIGKQPPATDLLFYYLGLG